MKIEERLLDHIEPYSKNAKKHPKKQIEKIAASIEEFGFNQPIVVDKEGVIIVGHGRYLAALYLGREKAPVLQIDIDEDKAKAYRLADNKLNESDWDMELVIQELKRLEGPLLELTGFSSDLILDKKPKDDDVPYAPEKPKSKLGDIYELGNHRVLCGDSTKKEDIEKLMEGKKAEMCFTDPPYNVDYTGGMGTHEKNEREGILNDKMSKNEFYSFLTDVSKNIVSYTKGGVYICMSSSELDTLKLAWESAGGHWQSFIIWVKNNFTLSRADYQHIYEPILYGWPKSTKNHFFVGDRDRANVWEDLRKVKTEYKDDHTIISFQGYKVKIKGKVEAGEVIRKKQRTDIWRHDKPTKSSEHPTMKPVALVTEAIVGSSQKEEIVLDPFLGSGSTLIAAEKTGRKCYGMELDPKYVDVIVQRYVDYTENNDIKLNGKKIKW